MAHIHFPIGTFVEIAGARYEARYTHGRIRLMHVHTGEVFVCEQPDGSQQLPTQDQFEDLLADGAIAVRSLHSGDRIRNYNEESEWTRDQAITLTPKAALRTTVCQVLDEHGVLQGVKAIDKGMDQYWTPELERDYGPRPSASTIRNWRATRGRVGDRHPRHMVDLTGRTISIAEVTDRTERLMWDCIMQGIVDGLIVPDIHAIYVSKCRAMYAADGLDLDFPENATKDKGMRKLRRRYNKIRNNKALYHAISKQSQEQDWSGSGKPLTADFSMQFVIIDHTEVDLHKVCYYNGIRKSKAWITLAIDVKSRAILAYLITFIRPAAWAVSEIFRRICLPKRPPAELGKKFPILRGLWGRPDCIIFDNGGEFLAQNVEAAARDAGISVRFCPVMKPRYRAICERAIGTINRLSTRMVPGRTMTIHDARRLKYDAQEHAFITIDEFEAIVHQTVAIYNISPNSDLNDQQPALLFQKSMRSHGIVCFTELDSFCRDVMEIRTGVSLRRSGIRAFGLRYHDANAVLDLINDLLPLEPRRRRKDDTTVTVDFRYDSHDISRIYVWNRHSRKYVTLRCDDEDYADGMPLHMHEDIRAAAKAEGLAFDSELERLTARGKLVQAVRALDPAGRAASDQRAAEMLEIPRLKHVTGNLVAMSFTDPAPAELGDFIGSDRARLSSLDQEILAPRSRPTTPRRKSAAERRQDDALRAQQALDASPPVRRLSAERGGYK